ncbi:hypothetical protein [Ekhidna sp. To15]|uniref:hypothetical protein n=1 Tax=Ekhidna sp. To15 TaxID=3395267 RepID=UPI003F51BFBF
MKVFLFTTMVILLGVMPCLGNVIENEFEFDSLEYKALVCLIDELTSKSYLNKDVLIPLDFEEDFEDFKSSDLYSNEYLCLITEPEDIYDPAYVGFSKQLSDNLRVAKDSTRKGYVPKEFSPPENVSVVNYKKFIDLKNTNSYLFTVRQHIRYEDISLVQIHVTPYEKSYNPFEYTFYMYFNRGQLVNWNITIEEDLDFDIDC